MAISKTSLTHPLMMACVTPLATAGKIGMTLCPGRKGRSESGGRWERDLSADLDKIRSWRPDLVLTLLEEHEFAKADVPEFRRHVVASGVPWAFAAIPDGAVPGRDFLAAWEDLGPRVRDILRRGGLVLIHCRAGLGRTGMIAALLLIDLGMTPQNAIDAVRSARGQDAIERPAQETYVRAYRPSSSTASASV